MGYGGGGGGGYYTWRHLNQCMEYLKTFHSAMSIPWPAQNTWH